ncbi:hypothetical protein ACF1AJ_02770 [Leifsonia sp. NPDC014704]|uniref:hypothetical protein n=1 Tax=Leifsonia sp. NPDC014704 TaxID=3364123 RepID=UPI0036F49422
MRRTVATLVAAVLLTSALAACAAPLRVGSDETGDSIARDAARQEAERIAETIDDSRPRNVLASDLAYRYSDSYRASSGAAPTVTADDVELSVQAMSWKGMTRDPGGARITLRITAHAPSRSASLAQKGWSEGDWSGCFAFRVRPFFQWSTTKPKSVICPPAPASPPPTPLPNPSLPADTADRISAVLAAATPKSLAGDLKAAFPDDSVRHDPVTGAHLTRDSGAEGTVLGVAVGISGTTDCLVGKRDADGSVRVWHPANITLQSGEAGCTLSNALHPVTTH